MSVPRWFCPTCGANNMPQSPSCFRCGSVPPAPQRRFPWRVLGLLLCVALAVPCLLGVPLARWRAAEGPASLTPQSVPAKLPAAPVALPVPENPAGSVFRVHSTDFLVPPMRGGVEDQPGELRCPFCGGSGSIPGTLRDCRYCLGTRTLSPAQVQLRLGKRVVVVPLDQPSDYVR